MGWEEYSLNAHIFPMAVPAILEGVNWLCIDNLLCKTIPMTHHSVTEKIFSGIQTTTVDWKSLTVSSTMISSVATFKKLLLIDLLYICKYFEGSMRSPLILLLSSVVSPSLCNLDSYGNFRNVGTIFVAVLWTLSRICISFTRWGDQAWTQYSIWGRM